MEPEIEIREVTTDAVNQLRTQIVGLSVAFLVMSTALSLFVLKQNRNLSASASTREQQIAQMQELEKRVLPALNDLAGYSLTKPELTAIFARYGLQIGQTNPPAQR